MSDWTEIGLKSFAESFVDGSRWQLAQLARDRYRQAGRGLIVVTIRGLAPDSVQERPIQIGYRPLAQYQRTMAKATTDVRIHVDRVVEMVQRYDPDTEAVCIFVAGPHFLTTARTIQIDPRVLVCSDPAVH